MTRWIVGVAAGWIGCAAALGDVGQPTADVQRAIGTADAAIAADAGGFQQLATQLAQQADALAAIGKRFDASVAAQKQLAPLIDQATKRATADVDGARREFAARDVAVREATNAITVARADLAKRTADAQRAAGAERRAFTASPERARLDAAMTTAQATLDRATADVDARLGEDVRYATLAAETARLEKDVQAKRAATPVDADALADASTAWIAAKNQSEGARRDMLARSDAFTRAGDALAKAKADVEASEAAFERSILTRPGVAEAQLAVQSAADAIRAATDRLTLAKQEQARAATAFADRRAAADAIAKLNRDGDATLAELQQDLKRSQASVAAIGKLLADRADDVLDVRGTLREAIALCRKVDTSIAASSAGTKKKP